MPGRRESRKVLSYTEEEEKAGTTFMKYKHALPTLPLLILDRNIIGKCSWSDCCEGKGEESRDDGIFWQLDEEIGRGFEVKMKKVKTIIRK